jgi:hypothetical protein
MRLLALVTLGLMATTIANAAQLDCTRDNIRVYVTIEADTITVQSPNAFHGGMLAEKRVFHAKSSLDNRFIEFSGEFSKPYDILGGAFQVTIFGTIDKASSTLESGSSSNINSGEQSHASYDCKPR